MATISKEMLRALRVDIDAALVAVAQKHGLQSLVAGNCTFAPEAGSFVFKVEGTVPGAAGKDGVLYDQIHGMLGLPDRGTDFTANGKTYVIVGCNTTGTKIKATHGGRLYLWPVDAVKRICGTRVPA